MKILITSGGTTEKIDNVRSIINHSTGRLGCAIAEAFATRGCHVFYLCGKNAARPTSQMSATVLIDDADSLKSAMEQLFATNAFDIIIHAMAVSDYRVKAITDANGISLAAANKIDSANDEICLVLEKTPKIIGMFRKIVPTATLVGFKLLDNVSRGTLIDAGHRLLVQNDCDFVLANDAADFTDDFHKGYLIDKNCDYSEYGTKSEIAQAIVEATLAHRRNT